eukprot:5046425-Pyramimonas_sp.AAC.1
MHAQWLTAHFGKFPWESERTMDQQGRLLEGANPWAKRVLEDLEAMEPLEDAQRFLEVLREKYGNGVGWIFLDPELQEDFTKVDVSLLRSLDVQKPACRKYTQHGTGPEDGDVRWRCFMKTEQGQG